MKQKKNVVILIALTLLLSACNLPSSGAVPSATPAPQIQPTEESAPSASAAAPVAAPSPTETAAADAKSVSSVLPYLQLQAYQGDAFSLQYPANAQIAVETPDSGLSDFPMLSQSTIHGPEIAIKPGDADWTRSGPGYDFTVMTFSNPSQLDVETWANAYISAKTSMPAGDSGSDPGTRTVLNGYPAVRAGYFGGDRQILEYYLSTGTQILALRYADVPVENEPIALLQKDIYALIMGTLSIAGEDSQDVKLSENLKYFSEMGFSFRYPANAQAAGTAADPEALTTLEVNGPAVSVKPVDADWTAHGLGYSLLINTFDNPNSQDAETWARDRLIAGWQAAQGGPYPGPVLEGGQIDESLVGQTSVAGTPAFWVAYFGGDSYVQALYLASRDRIVEIRFAQYPEVNNPIEKISEDAIALLLSSFHLVDPFLQDPFAEVQRGTWAACTDAGYPISYLNVGMLTYVSSESPQANLLRENPTATAAVLGAIESGEWAVVTGGPACAEGLTWWQVRAEKDGLTGWTAEGDADAYWLIPY